MPAVLASENNRHPDKHEVPRAKHATLPVLAQRAQKDSHWNQAGSAAILPARWDVWRATLTEDFPCRAQPSTADRKTGSCSASATQEGMTHHITDFFALVGPPLLADLSRSTSFGVSGRNSPGATSSDSGP